MAFPAVTVKFPYGWLSALMSGGLVDWWLVEPTWLLITFCLVLGKSPMKIQMKIPTNKILEKPTASSSRNCSVAIADRNVWKRARGPPCTPSLANSVLLHTPRCTN